MDLPITDPKPVKDKLLQFQCNNCDTELVHKIAQSLLTGLATVCVDSTTGDPFRAPQSVAVTLRKEMVDYLTQKSETFTTDSIIGIGESIINQGEQREISEDPIEIISDLMDDFANLKRNIFSRVSSWLLSESREDKIDDFAIEMESDSFWPIDRREGISEILLKNIDIKGKFHCGQKFESREKLAEHLSKCSYMKMSCINEGCKSKFSAFNREDHESVCPYKVIECDQKCGERILRREMDKHCITVCKMRLINCPFYQIGCESAFSQCEIERHCEEFVRSHLLYALQIVHKKESFTVDELNEQVQLLEKSGSLSELSRALDVRSLTLAVKELETKIKRTEREN